MPTQVAHHRRTGRIGIARRTIYRQALALHASERFQQVEVAAHAI